MTERERWVVYPLLFLALGAALRDKLVDRTVTKRIECQELSIVDGDSDGRQPPHVFAKIGRTEATATSPSVGYLVVNGEVGVFGGVDVKGALNVDGVVNAKQYAFQNIPIVPMFQAIPGIPAPALQAVPGRRQPNAQGDQVPGRQRKSASSKEAPDSESNASSSKSNSSDAPPKN